MRLSLSIHKAQNYNSFEMTASINRKFSNTYRICVILS